MKHKKPKSITLAFWPIADNVKPKKRENVMTPNMFISAAASGIRMKFRSRVEVMVRIRLSAIVKRGCSFELGFGLGVWRQP